MRRSVDRVQSVVIGAGVIGLACARKLSELGLETIVLEKGESIGSGISSRNSEVIHAGIYYPKGTLKAEMCTGGRESLYQYLKERSIPHQQCGKLIIASSEAEIPQLHSILKKATENGVELRMYNSSDVKAMEPTVRCSKALFSPRTGIFDSHMYMQSLQGDAEAAGAVFVYNCSVLSGKCSQSNSGQTYSSQSNSNQSNISNNSSDKDFPSGSSLQQNVANEGITIETTQGLIQADILINASGLHSIQFVEHLEGYPKHLIPKSYFSKGNYFSLKSAPFSTLVYPIPEMGGLGIHATIDMAGAVRFGPDVQWLMENQGALGLSSFELEYLPYSNSEVVVEEVYDKYLYRLSVPTDFSVDTSRSKVFYEAIRRYYPDIKEEDLVPAYSGIRPKLYGPSGPISTNTNPCTSGRDLNDFIIEGPERHGIEGLVNLFGIESPGLTSSLAIAEHVVNLLQKQKKYVNKL